jgi:plastocyanin
MATQRYIRVGLVMAAALVVAALLPMIGASREADPVREVRLVVRDMTYYLDGQEQPNPTLRLHAGERVKLVLRSEDEGMQHDFRVRAWDIGTDVIDGKGERAMTFRVPLQRGAQEYSCTPHPLSMRGVIEIE